MAKKLKVEFNHSSTKIKTLVDAISRSIMQGQLKMGDNLLSINEAKMFYGVSRDTVFKAYSELKEMGVIDSTPMKGYFVKGDVNRVLLLLDNYSPFKKDLYHRLAASLPMDYKVDLVFHQYNEDLFETIVRESIGKYSTYVVMNFSEDQFSKALNTIPQNKLLLLDFGNFEKSNISYICQDFGKALYESLSEGLDALRKFRKMVFVFPEDLRHPVTSIDHFRHFCSDNGFEAEVIRRSEMLQTIEEGSCYISIDTDDLVKIVKGGDQASLRIGYDFGVIAYNDDPVLEIIKTGISAISINFGLMGEMAAHFVKTKEVVQEYLPTKLIIRGSI